MAVQDPTTNGSKPIYGAYYPSWVADTVPPSKLNFSMYDVLFFAFATPSSAYGVSLDDGSASTLNSLVSAARNGGHDTKVVLSIGGWGGCDHYSDAMKSSNRDSFVDAVVSAVKTYNLDGVDVDWEYPNDAGAGNGQGHSSEDAANLLSFFQALRKKLGNEAIISAAVTDQPFKGPDGNPLSDVSEYAKVMSYVNLMNYDVYGSSSTPGPNAPLGDLCGDSSQPESSAQAALKQWTAANFPANQLLLGMPLYGYVSKSSKQTLQHRDADGASSGKEYYREKVLAMAGRQYAVGDVARSVDENRRFDTKFADDQSVFVNGGLGRRVGKSQQVHGPTDAFSDLVSHGVLKQLGDRFVADNGYTEGWDNCSETPFVYDTSRETLVTYDNHTSLALKTQCATNSGMGGVFTWSLDQDLDNTLQNAIRASLSLNTNGLLGR
ncbi:glycoside hydrolase superfamily [Fomitopsis serialis]|uniref:glycoside hydrolase superfamily n=1 Tax=Fomitopsis serialis TaxID=139415 RepID=UPI002007CB01|nr:glycoside hydrolase superfamily [Neoantrodia serialis]KAH9927355.1 glycoside hydrolase superfamily [Neoantrodia serialis]